VAEGARLESVFARNRNVGSNPTLSARLFEFNRLTRDLALANPAARLKPLSVTKTLVDTYDDAELEKDLPLGPRPDYRRSRCTNSG
jgi:hypothetical protein